MPAVNVSYLLSLCCFCWALVVGAAGEVGTIVEDGFVESGLLCFFVDAWMGVKDIVDVPLLGESVAVGEVFGFLVATLLARDENFLQLEDSSEYSGSLRFKLFVDGVVTAELEDVPFDAFFVI